MTHKRRDVLKTAAAATSASLLTVGTAAADEDCTETVDTWEESLTFAGVGAAGQFTASDLVPVIIPPSYNYRPSGFEGSELEGRRLDVTATWGVQNEVGAAPGQGPNDISLTLRQAGSSDPVAVLETGQETNPVGENRLELQLKEGESGPGGSSELILEDGLQYQYVLEARNGTGLRLEIETEFQTFEPGCLDDGA